MQTNQPAVKAQEKNILALYLGISKPGIILGNLITMFAGFAFASKDNFDLLLFFYASVGLILVIGSACIFNNLIDREIDSKMTRTKSRALVSGEVSWQEAFFLGLGTGILGGLILGFLVNFLTFVVAAVGFFIYVGVYSHLKRKTSVATLIGSIAGATPPLVGFAAANGALGMQALLLFLIVVFWQMPHFYAIGIYRLDDYLAASIPILPVKKGMRATKIQMVFYAILFFAAALLPTFFHYAGYLYLSVATLVSFYWLCLCIQGFWVTNDKLWAKKIFRFSLLVILAISIFISMKI